MVEGSPILPEGRRPKGKIVEPEIKNVYACPIQGYRTNNPIRFYCIFHPDGESVSKRMKIQKSCFEKKGKEEKLVIDKFVNFYKFLNKSLKS